MAASLPPGHRTIVIGAAGAIGSAVCEAYAKAGAVVTVLDINSAGAEQVLKGLPGSGHRFGAIDVTNRSDVVRAAAEAWEVAPFHSVVYSAGIETTCDVIDTDWDEYYRVIAVNLHGTMYAAQAFGRLMVENGQGGSLVFLSSVAGKRGEAGAAAYCASKFGVLGVVESFAAEVGRFNVRVNAICPGNVDSPMLRAVAAAEAHREGKSVQEVLDSYAAVAAERRLVRADEVGRVAVWLASPYASGVNGESVNVDAGALTG